MCRPLLKPTARCELQNDDLSAQTALTSRDLVRSMGKNAAGRSFEPPAADYRRKTGNFHRKVGKAELKETETRAVARRQDSEITKILIGLIIFAIFRSAANTKQPHQPSPRRPPTALLNVCRRLRDCAPVPCRSCLLYLYLSYVAIDDDEPLEPAAAAAAS